MFSKNIICLLNKRSYSQSTLPVPVIKVPKYVKKYIDKIETVEARRQMLLRRKITYRGNTSIPVLSSNEGEYNHYLGQEYSDRYPLPLLSKYWYKPKSSGQKFTIHRYDTNPSLPIMKDENDELMNFQCINEFEKLNLNATICESLKNDFNFVAPTPIQTLAIPRIIENQHVLLAAETGCGKTIAYLAPMIDKISQIKKKCPHFPDTPLGLIIVPGRELAEQIAEVGFKLGHSSGVNVKVLVSDGTFKKRLKPVANCYIDILVATIGSLKKLNSRVFKLGNVQHLVLDEADTLTDNSFIADLSAVMQTLTIHSNFDKFQGKAQGTQITFASSIYPSNISELFSDFFTEKDVFKISSNYLHRIQPHVEQKFWRVDNDSRSGDILHLAKLAHKRKEATLIFCNKSRTCDWMSEYFQDNGVPNVKLHGAVPPMERSKIFQTFQNGQVDILCCTDIVSRGLDTQRVKHVINFDFPNSTSDYILRCGRVGRVGTNQGRVTNLVVSKSGVYTVQEIETGVRNAIRIPNVDSNIKKKIQKLYFTF